MNTGRILAAMVLLLFQTLVFADGKERAIGFSYNPVSGLIDEQTISVDFFTSAKTSFGLSLGMVYPNKWFDPMPLSPSQNTWPGSAYSGFVCRANFAYYLPNLGNYGQFYFSPQFVSKYVYYNHHTFLDGGDSYVFYIRDEKTVVAGMDLILGMMICPDLLLDANINNNIGSQSSSSRHFYFGLWAGLAGRIRFRYMNTYDIDDRGDDAPPISGKEDLIQPYLFPTVGVKIGFIIQQGK